MRETSEITKTISIRELWQLLLRYKWYLIIPMIIMPLAAILATYFISPTYESTTKILMKESNILPPSVQRGLESGRHVMRETPAELGNALSNQIGSTKYIKSLIAKLDIPVPDAVKQLVSEKARTMSDVSVVELADNLLVQSIRNNISVYISGSNVIVISVIASSPMMSRKMTQTLAEIFLEESLAQELAGIQGSISFTEEQLAVYREKLYNAQNKLKRFRQNMITASVDEDTTTMNYNLISIFSAVETMEIEISEIEQRKVDIGLTLRTYKVQPSAVNLPGKVLKLKSDLMNTIPRLVELLSRYNWRDAKVVGLNEEAKNLIVSANNEIESYIPKAYPDLSTEALADLSEYLVLDTRLEFMRTKTRSMEKSIGRIKALLTRDPDIEVSLDRLQSEVNRYRELYNLFVQHSQYAAIDQSAKKVEAQSKYMIVQPAVLPLAPINPNRIMMFAIGIIIGLMIGGGIIVILIMLDDSFKKIEEVEEYLKIPVVATIPRISTPYSAKKKDRVLIYTGTAISFILVVAILYMKFKSG